MELYLKAILLGIVEGITEFLPVSSTGHLLITEFLFNARQSDAFNILIQIGPIVAVTLVFSKDIFKLLTGFTDRRTREELMKLTACFLITCIAGFTAKKLGFSLPETVLPIAIATLVGGGIIFWVEWRIKGRDLRDSTSWLVVIAVAAGQVLAAVFPGTSRSGAAIIAAMLLGVARPTAVRFAFLVGIPTMFAAGAFQLKEAIDADQAAELLSIPAITAFIAATATAWLTVVWLLKFVQHRTFISFAWYRLGLGVLMIAFVIIGFMK